MKSFMLLLSLLCLLALTGCSTVTTQFHFERSGHFETIAPSTPTITSVPTAHPNPYQIKLEIPPPKVTLATLPTMESLNESEVACMAQAIYFEARGESEKGQIAVGYVILNRMEDSRFSSTACGVVHKAVVRNGRIVRNRCQFKWYCDGKADVPKNPEAYARAVELAKLVMLRFAPNPIGKALFFHGRSARSRPPARRRYVDTHRIGHHFFYSYAML